MTTLTPNEAKLIRSLLNLWDAVFDSGLSDKDPGLCKAFEEVGDYDYHLFGSLKAKAKLVIANHS